MSEFTINRHLLWLVFLAGFAVTSCYPTGKVEQITETEMKDERHFPNGTVIGRYNYVDNEGNPIQVKYYANEDSYGVELKSFKVEAPTTSVNAIKAAPESHLPNPKTLSDVLNSVYQAPKQRTNDPFEYLNKQTNKRNHYKEKPISDFETYYQNELKGSKKCGKEKVRVYFDKSRRIRETLRNYDADKYCEQL